MIWWKYSRLGATIIDVWEIGINEKINWDDDDRPNLDNQPNLFGQNFRPIYNINYEI